MTPKIWFTSDNHFFHKNILKFSRATRIGDTVEEMNDKMIEIWNSQVAMADTVYMLGDFSFGSEEKTVSILGQLNGRLHLVRGNHEHWIGPTSSTFFEWIKDYAEITIDGQKIVMFHFPILEWNRMHHGAFHLYGHVHGGLQVPGRAMDVGIDARHEQRDMKLWSWEEVKARLSKETIRTHHGKMDT